MSISTNDPFIGRWAFNPEKSRYEFGPMPDNAFYTIEPHGEGYRIVMEWDSADGEHHEQAYDGIPDGKEYPYEGGPVDAVSMTRVDDRTLDSAAKKEGKVISFATRVLSEDRRAMEITMSGALPDGK
jgi:hypothetical protein